MSRIRSFAPIASANSRLLILGSIPGKESLRIGQYYGHPRNTFWRILQEVAGIDMASDYTTRIAALRRNGIAVWDVVRSCTRPGSLDADIDERSIVPNDFAAFFRSHQKITSIYFNGTKAQNAYRRHVLPKIAARFPHLAYRRLPSTSPANASYSFAQKLAAWRVIGTSAV